MKELTILQTISHLSIHPDKLREIILKTIRDRKTLKFKKGQFTGAPTVLFFVG